jgi:hypothetical protein
MGLNFFSRSEKSSNVNTGFQYVAIQPPNPDPSRYRVISQEIIGRYSIVEAEYTGCTTFNGRKLMVLKTDQKIGSKQLDPHLLGKGHPVIARFEPNKNGRRLAKMCVLYLKEFNIDYCDP